MQALQSSLQMLSTYYSSEVNHSTSDADEAYAYKALLHVASNIAGEEGGGLDVGQGEIGRGAKRQHND